jgi:hypothetical protein
MKYIRRLSLIAAALGIFALAKPASAATTQPINVTVTVDYISVSVASATWAIGQVAANTINISSAIAVTNDGNRQEDYSLSLTYTPGWTIGTGQAAGVDTFVMLALFTTTPVNTLNNTDFGQGGAGDDVVTTGATLREAARVLKNSGARRVVCIAVAH